MSSFISKVFKFKRPVPEKPPMPPQCEFCEGQDNTDDDPMCIAEVPREEGKKLEVVIYHHKCVRKLATSEPSGLQSRLATDVYKIEQRQLTQSTYPTNKN